MSQSENDKISNMKLIPLSESKYLRPIRIEFEINGHKKYWDMLEIHDSVSILIFNTSRQVVVLVKQFRPSMYAAAVGNLKIGSVIDTTQNSTKQGYSLELCAGIVDKEGKTIEEIAKEELLEECGYDVPVSQLKLLFRYRGVGVTGNLQSLYYVEVTDEQKTCQGGGLREEGEFIQVVELSIPQLQEYIASPIVASPAGFLTAVQWFLSNVVPTLTLTAPQIK